jgi:glycosyltransferase involved in cell wall biosynthesis
VIVTHVITGLLDGGAEAVLHRLCMADRLNTHVVISLRDEGKYGPLLEHSGVLVHCLNMPRGRVTWRGFWRLVRLLRELKPDVVQTWMYHADLVGGVAARLAGIRRLYWGLHNTALETGKTQRATILVVRVNSWLSKWMPSCIVSCSQKGVYVHRDLGYDANKFVVIPNGYDLERFMPDPQARRVLRSELGLTYVQPVIGMVARLDPQKDHRNLLAALAQLKAQGEDFLCLLVGTGMNCDNTKFEVWLDEFDLRDQVRLLGPRNEIPALMNALDVHVLSSYAEAFPNVLCEAMACGTPCVATEVGDAGVIVGETGWVVPPGNPALLAQAIMQALAERRTEPAGWIARQVAARRRILDNFSIGQMVASYHQVWQRVVCERG